MIRQNTTLQFNQMFSLRDVAVALSGATVDLFIVETHCLYEAF